MIAHASIPPTLAPSAATVPRKRRRPQTIAELDAAISRLDTLERADLLDRWADLYGVAPPHKISRKLLLQSISYRLQEAHHGGLPAAARRHLNRIAAELPQRGDAAITMMPRIKTGTRFVREWQGALHQVTVTPAGFEWQGGTHRSLSEIARLITGTRWNGWTFFGARSSRRKGATAHA